MPDIYVPVDTSGITSYYINVVNAGLLQRFAFEYCDMNREMLTEAEDIEKALPADDILLRSFVNYAAQNGIPARWYYINISHDLLVNQLKAMIIRDIKGQNGYFRIINRTDIGVKRALDEIAAGNTEFPIMPEKENDQNSDKK